MPNGCHCAKSYLAMFTRWNSLYIFFTLILLPMSVYFFYISFIDFVILLNFLLRYFYFFHRNFFQFRSFTRAILLSRNALLISFIFYTSLYIRSRLLFLRSFEYLHFSHFVRISSGSFFRDWVFVNNADGHIKLFFFRRFRTGEHKLLFNWYTYILYCNTTKLQLPNEILI